MFPVANDCGLNSAAEFNDTECTT